MEVEKQQLSYLCQINNVVILVPHLRAKSSALNRSNPASLTLLRPGNPGPDRFAYIWH